MAVCLRRPVISSIGLQISRGTHLRPFSDVSSRWADNKWGIQSQQPRQVAERSVKVAAKEMGKMPTDFGLFDETFIYPSRKNRPRLYLHPFELARLNWIRLKRKLLGLFSLTIYKFHVKPRLKLRPMQTAPTAVGLHNRLYTAIAEGDTVFLRDNCADGLQQSSQARIFSRPKGEKWRWELVKYNKRPKVMAHRASSLQIEGMGLRQAVVRIASRQRLTRYARDGLVIPGSGKEKDTVEYFVIQRRMEKGVEGEWMIWGTTGETPLEMVDEEQRVLANR